MRYVTVVHRLHKNLKMIQILQCLGNTRQLVISYISVIQFGWKKIIFYSGEPATGLSLERCNRRYGSGDKRKILLKGGKRQHSVTPDSGSARVCKWGGQKGPRHLQRGP